MVQDSTLHCQCTHPLPAKRRISDAQGDPGRAFYNCATQQCHFFLWEDELPSPPSSSPSAAAAAMIPAGPPLNSVALPLSPGASPILAKRKISVLETSKDSDEPPKRVKMTGVFENAWSAPLAGWEPSPQPNHSEGSTPSESPAQDVQATVADDDLTGFESDFDGVSETGRNPGSRSLRVAPTHPVPFLPPVSSPFLDALQPPTIHTPPGMKHAQYQEDAAEKNSRPLAVDSDASAPHTSRNRGSSESNAPQPSGSQSNPDPGPSVSPPHRSSPPTPVSKKFTLGDIDEMIESRNDVAVEMEVRAAELLAAAGRLREQGRQLEGLKAFVTKGAKGTHDGVGTEAKTEKGDDSGVGE